MKTKSTSGITGVGPGRTQTQNTRAVEISREKQSGAVKNKERQTGSDLRGTRKNPMVSAGHMDAHPDGKRHEDHHPAVKSLKGKY